MEQTLMTSGEAAKQLGVSWSLIWKLENLGVTPPARRLGRFRIYTPVEVEALRKAIEARGTAKIGRNRCSN